METTPTQDSSPTGGSIEAASDDIAAAAQQNDEHVVVAVTSAIANDNASEPTIVPPIDLTLTKKAVEEEEEKHASPSSSVVSSLAAQPATTSRIIRAREPRMSIVERVLARRYTMPQPPVSSSSSSSSSSSLSSLSSRSSNGTRGLRYIPHNAAYYQSRTSSLSNSSNNDTNSVNTENRHRDMVSREQARLRASIDATERRRLIAIGNAAIRAAAAEALEHERAIRRHTWQQSRAADEHARLIAERNYATQQQQHIEWRDAQSRLLAARQSRRLHESQLARQQRDNARTYYIKQQAVHRDTLDHKWEQERNDHVANYEAHEQFMAQKLAHVKASARARTRRLAALDHTTTGGNGTSVHRDIPPTLTGTDGVSINNHDSIAAAAATIIPLSPSPPSLVRPSSLRRVASHPLDPMQQPLPSLVPSLVSSPVPIASATSNVVVLPSLSPPLSPHITNTVVSSPSPLLPSLPSLVPSSSSSSSSSSVVRHDDIALPIESLPSQASQLQHDDVPSTNVTQLRPLPPQSKPKLSNAVPSSSSSLPASSSSSSPSLSTHSSPRFKPSSRLIALSRPRLVSLCNNTATNSNNTTSALVAIAHVHVMHSANVVTSAPSSSSGASVPAVTPATAPVVAAKPAAAALVPVKPVVASSQRPVAALVSPYAQALTSGLRARRTRKLH